MAEPEQGALSIALDTFVYIARTAHSVPWTRSLSLMLRLVSLPLRIALPPLRSLAGLVARWLALFFAPALYLLAYGRACVRGVVAFVVGLQPFYVFFSTAAVVGIIAGITLAISSLIITTYLGMRNDSTAKTYDEDSLKKKQASPSSTISPSNSEDRPSSSSSSASSFSIKTEPYLMEPSPTARRQYATGLMSQVILEEEDDSDADDF